MRLSESRLGDYTRWVVAQLGGQAAQGQAKGKMQASWRLALLLPTALQGAAAVATGNSEYRHSGGGPTSAVCTIPVLNKCMAHPYKLRKSIQQTLPRVPLFCPVGDDPPGAWSPTRGNEVIENRIHLGLEGSSLQPPSRLSPITTTVSADGFAFGGYVVVLL